MSVKSELALAVKWLRAWEIVRSTDPPPPQQRSAPPTFRYQVVGIPANGAVALTLTRWTAWLLRDALAAKLPGDFTVCDMNGVAVERPEEEASGKDRS